VEWGADCDSPGSGSTVAGPRTGALTWARARYTYSSAKSAVRFEPVREDFGSSEPRNARANLLGMKAGHMGF